MLGFEDLIQLADMEIMSSLNVLCIFLINSQANSLLKKSREEIPIELLNNIGVLHFERGEFEASSVSVLSLNLYTF